MKQWHCLIAGQQYGPVGEDVLRAWALEGRVRPSDLVWTEGMPQWAPAGAVEGLLAAGPPAGVRRHRGAAVLTLGIISIVAFCGVDLVCGIIGLTMSGRDLEAMRSGRMDRSGEGLTRAGRICCIVGIVLGALGLLGTAAWALMVARMGARPFWMR